MGNGFSSLCLVYRHNTRGNEMTKMIEKIAKAMHEYAVKDGAAIWEKWEDVPPKSKQRLYDVIVVALEALSNDDLEAILNERRYEVKAKKMIECDSRD